MIPQPVVVGLALCEKVMVEEGNKNVSLIGCFTKIATKSFPSPPARFALHAALTGGVGQGTIDLEITRLETDQLVYSGRSPIRFVDRLSTVNLILRLKGLSFPAPGKYQFALSLDGDWLTQTVLNVLAKGTKS